MPRAKKKNVETSVTNNVNEVAVANLIAGALEIYKTKCKTEILQFQNLERENVVEVAKVLDTQETIVRNQVFDQVNLLFRK